jgi:peptidyl-dipeptidase A
MTSEITGYLRQHERTVAPLHKDYSEKFWELSLSGDEQREKSLVAAKEKYLKVYSNREEFKQLRQWMSSDVTLLPNESRQLKLIHDTFVPNQIEEDVLRDIVQRETRIENLFNTFRANFEGGNASDNQLREILRGETDGSRRRAAWEASKQVGQEIAPHLLELVAIRNREAVKLGYTDYYSMMFQLQELDEKWVFSLFDRLEKLSEEAFTRMKADLDAVLKHKYGIPAVESYPWLYSDPFFQEFPSAGVAESLDEAFKEADIEALTSEHYNSIGLDIGDLLRKADLYERDGKSQHAFCRTSITRAMFECCAIFGRTSDG